MKAKGAFAAWVGGLVLLACAGGHAPEPPSSPARTDGPFVRVLGTAQDGGLPHAGCWCPNCSAARNDPGRRRSIASVAIESTASGRAWLVDATPDIREQLDRLRDIGPHPEARTDRAPVAGVLLTHAHLGHYTGLAFFGYEAVHTRGLPVDCTPRMAAYLRANGPWSQLVRLENVVLRERAPGEAFELEPGLTVTPIAVPHRDEYADTVAFLIAGPRRKLFYVPDTDTWDTWARPLREVLDGVDVALLDATFYSTEEIPGRDVTKIGHPLVTTTMDLLEDLVRDGRLHVAFTHLNHSNPALDPASPARREIERRGFAVASDGEEFPL